jgi:hypothetical protein
MKRSLLLLALLAVVGVANAGDINNGSNHHNTTNNGDTNNQGGTGIGVGVGIAGAAASSSATAVSSNANLNHNTNSNSNVNKQGQGQLQGQLQGQSQNASSNQSQGQSTDNANNSSQNVNVEGDHFNYKRNPVSTAYAATIAPTANCALGVSGGFQTIGFGASFGKAYIDENCASLEKVRSVAQVLGDVKTAEAMMCQDEKYAKARATAGRPCAVEQE